MQITILSHHMLRLKILTVFFFIKGGAWLVAYKEEQKKRFDAVLCPLTRKDYLEGPQKSKRNVKSRKAHSVTKGKILDGMYLVCVHHKSLVFF